MTSQPTSTTQPASGLFAGSYLRLFKHYLGPQWRRALLMALLLLAATGLQLLGPQFLRQFIDLGLTGGAASVLTRVALLYLLVALFKQLFNASATYLGADVGWSATNVIRQDLAAHTLALDMTFHNSRNSGEMIERIDGDVTALSDFFSQFGVRIFGALLLLAGTLIVLWLENALIGLALTLFTLFELLVLQTTRRLSVPATRLEREATAKMFGFIEERLSGIEDIRANGGGQHAMHRFDVTARDYYRLSVGAWRLRSVTWLSGYGAFIVGISSTLALVIYLVRGGSITVGTGYLVMQYMFLLQTPIDQITQQMQVLQKASASLGRISDLFGERSQLTPGEATLPAGALEVAFDAVSFGYDDKTVLNNVSFRLQPGRVLGLLGRTGSGKSTLTRLLFRFYDPDSGAVRLNGLSVSDLNPESLHERVGLVTQEVQLFGGTVRDNLSFFDAEVSDKRILEVLNELGLSGWLETLPEGLDTRLSPSGGNLSAGEAQLLAFARVFLKDPGLVILDEPSSRLDPATEKRLELALNRLLQNRTAIIIAHRLATVERADEVLILRDGWVLERGERTRLAADTSSEFYALLKAGGDLDEGTSYEQGETHA